jgi:hypothetical protein
MEETIEVEVLASDIKTSSFLNNEDCAVARALKRRFPDTHICVGGISVELDNSTYYITKESRKVLLEAYDSKFIKEINNFVVILTIEKLCII